MVTGGRVDDADDGGRDCRDSRSSSAADFSLRTISGLGDCWNGLVRSDRASSVQPASGGPRSSAQPAERRRLAWSGRVSATASKDDELPEEIGGPPACRRETAECTECVTELSDLVRDRADIEDRATLPASELNSASSSSSSAVHFRSRLWTADALDILPVDADAGGR